MVTLLELGGLFLGSDLVCAADVDDWLSECPLDYLFPGEALLTLTFLGDGRAFDFVVSCGVSEYDVDCRSMAWSLEAGRTLGCSGGSLLEFNHWGTGEGVGYGDLGGVDVCGPGMTAAVGDSLGRFCCVNAKSPTCPMM